MLGATLAKTLREFYSDQSFFFFQTKNYAGTFSRQLVTSVELKVLSRSQFIKTKEPHYQQKKSSDLIQRSRIWMFSSSLVPRAVTSETHLSSQKMQSRTSVLSNTPWQRLQQKSNLHFKYRTWFWKADLPVTLLLGKPETTRSVTLLSQSCKSEQTFKESEVRYEKKMRAKERFSSIQENTFSQHITVLDTTSDFKGFRLFTVSASDHGSLTQSYFSLAALKHNSNLICKEQQQSTHEQSVLSIKEGGKSQTGGTFHYHICDIHLD